MLKDYEKDISERPYKIYWHGKFLRSFIYKEDYDSCIKFFKGFLIEITGTYKGEKMFLEEIKEMELEALEKRQEELIEELREVEQEIELFEEDYRPDLEVKRSSIKAELKKVEKELNKRNNSHED
jgi:vacuolar-type H+-ATPase subunit I/STV1